MKKLMIAAAIVCAAAMSQAASIAWSSDYNYVTKDGTIQTADTADAGTFVLCYLGDTKNGYSWDDAEVVNEGTVKYASMGSSKTAKAGGTFAFTFDDGDYKDGDVFGVMFQDASGNLSQLVTPGDSPTAIAEAFTISGLTDDRYAGVMSFAGSNYTVASVPEPTSGLLLLLGVAGMALRRRRA